MVKYTSPEIQNELIALCAEQIFAYLKDLYNKSSFLAIIGDETTDKATHTQLSVCIRYLETVGTDINANEMFMGFSHAKSTKGDAIADVLIAFMNVHGLGLEKLRA